MLRAVAISIIALPCTCVHDGECMQCIVIVQQDDRVAGRGTVQMQYMYHHCENCNFNFNSSKNGARSRQKLGIPRGKTCPHNSRRRGDQQPIQRQLFRPHTFTGRLLKSYILIWSFILILYLISTCLVLIMHDTAWHLIDQTLRCWRGSWIDILALFIIIHACYWTSLHYDSRSIRLYTDPLTTVPYALHNFIANAMAMAMQCQIET